MDWIQAGKLLKPSKDLRQRPDHSATPMCSIVVWQRSVRR